MLDAILFDLDGTLLPMDYDEFTKGYLGLLSKAMEPHGYKKDALLGAMWKGVGAMVRNDGTATNKDVFWKVFFGLLGENSYNDIPKFDEFYTKEFHNAKDYTQPNGRARELVYAARAKAKKVVLATNPFFPRVAVNARLEWCGLGEDDFDYITEYENSSYCKPNPKYYAEICEKLGIAPEKCMMIGNNMQEDIAAAKALGMQTYLITDCLIDEGEKTDTVMGSFEDCINYVNALI